MSWDWVDPRRTCHSNRELFNQGGGSTDVRHLRRWCTSGGDAPRELLECDGDECGVRLVEGLEFCREVREIEIGKGEKERAIFLTLLSYVVWRGVGEGINRVK